MRNLLLALLLASPASAYQGGSLKPHGHTSLSDGGVLGTLPITGMLNIQSSATIGGICITSNTIAGCSGAPAPTIAATSLSATSTITFNQPLVLTNGLTVGTTKETAVADMTRALTGGWSVVASTWLGGPGSSGKVDQLGPTFFSFSGLLGGSSYHYRLEFSLQMSGDASSSLEMTLNNVVSGTPYQFTTIAISTYVRTGSINAPNSDNKITIVPTDTGNSGSKIGTPLNGFVDFWEDQSSTETFIGATVTGLSNLVPTLVEWHTVGRFTQTGINSVEIQATSKNQRIIGWMRLLALIWPQ